MLRVAAFFLLLTLPDTVGAAPEIARVLACEYKDSFSKFSVEAYLTPKGRLIDKAYFVSSDKELNTSLTQKSPRGGEEFRFVLAEEDLAEALRIQVFAPSDGRRDSVATFLGVAEPFNVVRGSCRIYRAG